MASLAQLEANRRNSQKSTGPRTETGKAASSRNAIKTGLYAQSLLIDGEDPDDLQSLALDYEDSCRPEGPLETALVFELIRSDWLLRRMSAVETQVWNEEIARREEGDGDDYDESITIGRAYTGITERLVLIQRRVSALERSYHRALADLHRLQSHRPSDTEAVAVPSPQPPVPNPRREAPIGFVPPPAAQRQPRRGEPAAPFGFVSPIRTAEAVPTLSPAPTGQSSTPARSASREAANPQPPPSERQPALHLQSPIVRVLVESLAVRRARYLV